MAIFDVTDVIMRTQSVHDRNRNKRIIDLIEWLTDNVGEHYGPGGDHSLDHNELQGNEVLHIGSGWQLERDWKGDPDGYIEVCWKVDITDEAKAIMFALKWTGQPSV